MNIELITNRTVDAPQGLNTCICISANSLLKEAVTASTFLKKMPGEKLSKKNYYLFP